MSVATSLSSPAPLSRVLFATGGSGGHLFPAVAIAEALRARFPDVKIQFATTGRAIEERICRENGLEQRVLPLLPLREARRHPLKFLNAARTSLRQSREWIHDWRPQCIVGTGGWSMTPVVLAARRSGVPVVLCEQNVIPGRATRWLARRAAVVCVSFAETASRLPTGLHIEVTGNPVRAAVAELTQRERPSDSRLLILGGSQGARALNDALLDIAKKHPESLRGWTILHQTGSSEAAAELAAAYRAANISGEVAAFFTEMPTVYKNATAAIARAGATTLAELACAGIPAILVPYPHAADDHQRANAQVYVDAGAAVIVPEPAASNDLAARLQQACASVLFDPERRASLAQSMKSLARPDAAARIVDILCSTARICSPTE